MATSVLVDLTRSDTKYILLASHRQSPPARARTPILDPQIATVPTLGLVARNLSLRPNRAG